MAQDPKAINVSNVPALRELVQEVIRTKQAKALRVDSGEEVFVIPASAARRRSPSKARPVARDDALFRLVGIGKSDTPSNDAEDKHRALEEAHRRLHS